MKEVIFKKEWENPCKCNKPQPSSDKCHNWCKTCGNIIYT